MTKELVKKESETVRLRKMLEEPSVMQQFQRAWKENSNGFMASMLEVVSTNKALQECSPSDIIRECLKAAVLKLPIGNTLGYASIVAYKQKPTFIIGYRGLIQLAVRTGQYKFINTDMVYEGEIVNKDRITGEIKITGEPKNRKVKGYLAHIELLNGFKKTIYMTKAEVLADAKRYSPAYRKGAKIWKDEEDKMCLKRPLRIVLDKYGIKSIDMLNIEAQEQKQEREIEDECITPLQESEPEDIKPKTDDAEIVDAEVRDNNQSALEPGF